MLLAAREVGVESVVAVPDHGGSRQSLALVHLLERAGVVVHTLPTLSWPRLVAYRWGISPAQATWTARHVGDFDLVHVHGVWGIGPLSGLTAGRLAGKPIVVTAHESLTAFDIDDSRSAARRRQKLLLKALYLRYATLFVLTSDLEARDSLPTFAPQRTVHYPVVYADTPVPEPRPRGEGISLRVGFLARIHPKKNLDLLIDAMGQLPSHVRLVIAGDGPADLVEDLHSRANDLGVSDRLEWLGFVGPGERATLLDSLDLLAMPSVFESFGLSAAEAMVRGVPVLVSERTGIAELIGRHGGGKVTKPETRSVAAAIRKLDNNRGLLAEMGRLGQEAVREELDYARIGEALRAAYSEAVRAATGSQGLKGA